MLCVHANVSTDWTFFSLDIIILTERRKEANNYVTQKTISPPRLGHFPVLAVLAPPPPHPLCVLLPLRSINVPLTGWKSTPPELSACLFSVIPESSENALITIPAVQGYLKVLVLSVSPGHGRTEGGERQEREIEKDGWKERERGKRDKGDVGRQVVSE